MHLSIRPTTIKRINCAICQELALEKSEQNNHILRATLLLLKYSSYDFTFFAR